MLMMMMAMVANANRSQREGRQDERRGSLRTNAVSVSANSRQIHGRRRIARSSGDAVPGQSTGHRRL